MKKFILLIFIFLSLADIGAKAELTDFSYDDFINQSSKYQTEGIDLKKDADSPQSLGKKLLNIISTGVKGELKPYINPFLTICIILIIATILAVLASDKDNNHIGLYAIYIICAVILSNSFFDITKLCVSAIDDVNDYMNATFSGYVALMISSGYSITAGYMQGIFVFISGTVSFFISKFIIPLLYSCGIAGLANGVAQSEDISLFIKSMLKFIKYTLGILLTLISAVMGFTGFTAITTDGLAVKTAKYAVSNFVPLVGSCLADTLNNVVYTSVVMKNTVGYIGFITIIMICISPIIKVFAVSFMIKLLSVISTMLRHNKMTDLADTLSSVAVGFGAILSLLSVIFVIMIGIIISIGG